MLRGDRDRECLLGEESLRFLGDGKYLRLLGEGVESLRLLGEGLGLLGGVESLGLFGEGVESLRLLGGELRRFLGEKGLLCLLGEGEVCLFGEEELRLLGEGEVLRLFGEAKGEVCLFGEEELRLLGEREVLRLFGEGVSLCFGESLCHFWEGESLRLGDWDSRRLGECESLRFGDCDSLRDSEECVSLLFGDCETLRLGESLRLGERERFFGEVEVRRTGDFDRCLFLGYSLPLSTCPPDTMWLETPSLCLGDLDSLLRLGDLLLLSVDFDLCCFLSGLRDALGDKGSFSLSLELNLCLSPFDCTLSLLSFFSFWTPPLLSFSSFLSFLPSFFFSFSSFSHSWSFF